MLRPVLCIGALLAVGITSAVPSDLPSPKSIFSKSRLEPVGRQMEFTTLQERLDRELLRRKHSAPIMFAPWAAGLALRQHSWSTSANLFCGATIISQNLVLTSAHCVEELRSEDIEILYGASALGEARRVKATRIVIHPDHRKGRFENSLAMLETENLFFSLSYFSAPLTFANAEPGLQPPSGDLKVFGWGTISASGSPSDTLVQIDVAVVERNLCNSPTGYAGKITPHEFCAASKINGIDACEGFAGSGLIAFSPSVPGLQLAGMVSWGEGCARANKPTVYISIPRYRHWIDQQVAQSRK